MTDHDKLKEILQRRLVSLIDLSLTLKHVHWNVVGEGFIGVHEMLDPHAQAVRKMVDDLAERIATMGGEPIGTPGALVAQRTWDDYPLARASTHAHLAQLDRTYEGIIADHRAAVRDAADLDPITQDLLIAQTGKLELFRWLVRAHLDKAD
ncbi:MAG: Dps family protein [Acidimicrobiia bacterium]